MKRSRTGALRTREAILAAALQAFARHGIRGASFQHVAELAGVTRGAVYWHFPDRVSLLREVFLGFQWPLDIGPDLQPYLRCHNPLALLRETLVLRIDNCLGDPLLRSQMALLLSQQRCCTMSPEWPPDLMAQLERQVSGASVRLVEVCALAQARGLLRTGCQPQALASSLHALALDCLRASCPAGLGAPAPQHRQTIAWLLQGAALSQT